MRTLLICAALVSLLTTAFLSNATSATSEVVLVPTVRVVRANGFVSWLALKNDTDLRRVTQDVSDYLGSHPIQMLDPAALASYLDQYYDVTASGDDYYYMYVVGPDGVTHEVCVPKPEIGIETGQTGNPILVKIEWHVDFN